MVDAEKLAGTFKLLSAEARIRIVKVLKRRAMCVTELTIATGYNTFGNFSASSSSERCTPCKISEERIPCLLSS